MAGVGALNKTIGCHLADVTDDFHTLIDFTRPDVTLQNLATCVANGKNIIIGTTGFSEEEKQQVTRKCLLQRTGTAEEVAKTVLFLIKDADYMTGSVLKLDGGFTLGSSLVPSIPKGVLD